ncbi:MAG: dihydrodipicolinate synthase family protein [Clostridiales bacterium]|mgnify:FL=1|jgi:4-hydroxy-tetrahydrodipicolinate synthase|nr:dihydrodipicolinate synthase family protein [Clostridiales bacterium]
MDTSSIKGIIVPIVTPVDEENHINEEAMARVVNYIIDGGVHGILAFGSNGEFFAIDADEQRKALACIVKTANKRVPVYMGIAGITTKECVETAKMAKEENADGISILPPMFISPSEDELYAHIVTIAETVPDLPVLLYNNPGKVGYGLSVNLVNRLADVPNIVGIKDTSGNMTLTAEFIRTTRDKGFKVMAGKDTMILGSLAYGAVGAIASTANIVPELVVEIYDKYMAGDIEGACEAQFKLTPFRNTFDKVSFPAGTKDACNLIGLDVGNSIKPNTTASPEVLDEMREILTELGYIKEEVLLDA